MIRTIPLRGCRKLGRTAQLRSRSRLRCHSLSVNAFSAASSASFSSGASTIPRCTPQFFMRVTA
jgi:hypothetical protein